MAKPLISVVMPVYNGEKFLLEAVESILNQTHSELELIVIDDCSTDQTPNILRGVHDPRLVVRRNAKNSGGTRSMNVGLQLSEGKYIARMDADDIAYPDRLETQFMFLEANPEVGMTHCNVEYIDQNGATVGGSMRRLDVATATWHMLFGSYAFHPTFMWDRERAEGEIGGYDESFEVAQDFDFAWKALRRIGFVGTEENLLKYRVHTGNVTVTKRARQLELVSAASNAHIAELLGKPVQEVEREFEDVRELAVFRDPREWSAARIKAVLPRYLLLWQQFRLRVGQDWTPGLTQAAETDLLNATGILIAARDFGSVAASLKQIQGSGVASASKLIKLNFQRRWQAKFGGSKGGDAHPNW